MTNRLCRLQRVRYSESDGALLTELGVLVGQRRTHAQLAKPFLAGLWRVRSGAEVRQGVLQLPRRDAPRRRVELVHGARVQLVAVGERPLDPLVVPVRGLDGGDAPAGVHGCRSDDLRGDDGQAARVRGGAVIARLVDLELDEPLADGRMLHHCEVVLQAGAEPHDVRSVLEIPGRPPLLVQRSDSAADEIRPDHLEGEPGLGEAKNPGGGDRELRVVSIDIALVVSVNRRHLANPAEFLWILLFNPPLQIERLSASGPASTSSRPRSMSKLPLSDPAYA